MTASMSEEPGSPQSFNELKLQEREFGASGEIHVPPQTPSHPPRADPVSYTQNRAHET